MQFLIRRATLLVACTAGALASAPAAQTLYTLDAAAAAVYEQTGPPAGPCGLPTGPLVGAFPTVGGVCPGLPPFPFGVPGDVAVDKITDSVFATDGLFIVQYTAGGAYVNSFPSPLPLTSGLGFDSAAGVLWLTDGFLIAAMPVPPAPGCFGPPPPIAPFPAPIGPGAFGGPLTDIEWDPSTGSLIACDATGVVGNLLPGGAPGPFGFAFAPAALPLAPFLTGLAIDTTLPGAGVVYVTDGALIGYATLPGGMVPAPPTFYTPAPVFPVAGGLASGLAFAAHGINFGPASTTGAALPFAGSRGHSFLGNPGFAMTVSGLPGSIAQLYFGGGGPLCPSLPILGLLLNLVPAPAPAFLGTATIPATGVGALPLPIPPAFPPGLGLSFQWLVLEPTLAPALSDGLHVTLSLP